jgi:hypothetical protein
MPYGMALTFLKWVLLYAGIGCSVGIALSILVALLSGITNEETTEEVDRERKKTFRWYFILSVVGWAGYTTLKAYGF